jgi:hypothetical protein
MKNIKKFTNVFVVILSFIALYLILSFFLADLIHNDACNCIDELK